MNNEEIVNNYFDRFCVYLASNLHTGGFFHVPAIAQLTGVAGLSRNIGSSRFCPLEVWNIKNGVEVS